MIKFVQVDGPVEVTNLRHGATCVYSGTVYMRVNSVINSGQDRQNEGQKWHGSYLNCKDYCLMLRLNDGRLSYFKRTTKVREVDINAEIVGK